MTAKQSFKATRDLNDFTMIFEANQSEKKIYIPVRNRDTICIKELWDIRTSSSNANDQEPNDED